MSNVCVEKSFKEMVWEIFKLHTSPLTARDVKHVLVTEHRLPSTVTQRCIGNACEWLVDKGRVARTEEKISSAYNLSGARKSYGFYRTVVLDTDQVLWVVRDHNFSEYGKPAPKKILYSPETRYLVAAMAGKHIGIDRVECELRSNEFYESKGWMVLS